MSAEVHDLVSRATQQLSNLSFQDETSMVCGDSDEHHGFFSLACRNTL